MFERMCLDGRSYNPTACLQKLNDNDSCIRIEALWLVEHLEVCLGEGAKERSEVLPFRDTFCLQLPRFSSEAITATIILLCNINTVRFFSLNYLFWTFIVQELQQDTFSPGPQGKCLIRGDIGRLTNCGFLLGHVAERFHRPGWSRWFFYRKVNERP